MIRIANDRDPAWRPIYRAVDDYLKTRSQAIRDGWSFRSYAFPRGCIPVADSLAIVDPPFDIPAAVEEELVDILGDMADLIGGILNPPESQSRCAFVVAAISKKDGYSGRALTNALDVDQVCAAVAEQLGPPEPRKVH